MGIASLLLATLGFVGGHFVLSSAPVRSKLVAKLGEARFLGAYSALMALLLIWLGFAFRGAPVIALWQFGVPGRWAPALVMPFALVLVVLGLTTKNVTAVGGERQSGKLDGVRGIVTVTRHPFLWGAALWAISHLVANGDAASLILFGGIALLALGGMPAIDRKRAVKLGDDWRAIAAQTSALPFAAALAGRTQIDWRGIGWIRPVVALVLYAAIMHAHRLVFGVSALPSAM